MLYKKSGTDKLLVGTVLCRDTTYYVDEIIL